MRRASVPGLPGEGLELLLDPETTHHLVRVLRLGPGDAVLLLDGRGGQAHGRIVSVDAEGARVVQVGPPEVRGASAPVHLLLGVLKGPAMDDAVRMATEAGMTDLHPVLSDRSVPTDGRPERWSRIVASAAEQCGRADRPTLHPAARLAEVVARLDGVDDRRVALPGAPRGRPATGPVAVAVGPEGGWSRGEVERLVAAGFAPLGLGPWVLRALTAAGVAVAAVVPE